MVNAKLRYSSCSYESPDRGLDVAKSFMSGSIIRAHVSFGQIGPAYLCKTRNLTASPTNTIVE